MTGLQMDTFMVDHLRGPVLKICTISRPNSMVRLKRQVFPQIVTGVLKYLPMPGWQKKGRAATKLLLHRSANKLRTKMRRRIRQGQMVDDILAVQCPPRVGDAGLGVLK